MGASHILLILIAILIIVVIWRGPTTLPLIGRAFGRGVKEARREIDEIRSDVERKRGDGSGGPPAGGPANGSGGEPGSTSGGGSGGGSGSAPA